MKKGSICCLQILQQGLHFREAAIHLEDVYTEDSLSSAEAETFLSFSVSEEFACETRTHRNLDEVPLLQEIPAVVSLQVRDDVQLLRHRGNPDVTYSARHWILSDRI